MVNIRVTERDIEIFWSIYQLECIRARDIASIWFAGEKCGLMRLQKLANTGYLERQYTVTNKGRKNYSVYGITDKAIRALAEAGLIENPRRAWDVKLRGFEMLRRIELSRICLKLYKQGWSYLGTKDAKIELGLSPNDPVQCMLKTPGGKIYQVYQVWEDVRDDTKSRMLNAISETKQSNVLLYHTGDPIKQTKAVEKILSTMEGNSISLSELSLVPLMQMETESEIIDMAYEMLNNSTEEKVMKYLAGKYDHVKKVTNRYLFGNISVEDKEAEYLVCNYLKRDILSLTMLSKLLTKREYAANKQKAIVLTWNGYANEVREKLEAIEPGREFIKIEAIDREAMMNNEICP